MITPQDGDLEPCVYSANSVMGSQSCDDAILQSAHYCIGVCYKQTATKRLGASTVRLISIKKIHSHGLLVGEKTGKVTITTTYI